MSKRDDEREKLDSKTLTTAATTPVIQEFSI